MNQRKYYFCIQRWWEWYTFLFPNEATNLPSPQMLLGFSTDQSKTHITRCQCGLVYCRNIHYILFLRGGGGRDFLYWLEGLFSALRVIWCVNVTSVFGHFHNLPTSLFYLSICLIWIICNDPHVQSEHCEYRHQPSWRLQYAHINEESHPA